MFAPTMIEDARLPLLLPLAHILTLLAVAPLRGPRPELQATLTEVHGVSPTGALALRVRLTMSAGWHIGGPQATAIGLPTQLLWHLPSGWHVTDEHWPTPTRAVVGHDTTYTYTRAVQVDVTLTTDRAAARTPLEVVLTYGLCREVCVPGQLTMTYTPK